MIGLAIRLLIYVVIVLGRSVDKITDQFSILLSHTTNFTPCEIMLAAIYVLIREGPEFLVIVWNPNR